LVLNKTDIILFSSVLSSPVYKPKANNGITKAAARTHIVQAEIKPAIILRLWRWNLYRNKRWKCIKYENEN
jgi:hypothetical protein